MIGQSIISQITRNLPGKDLFVKIFAGITALVVISSGLIYFLTKHDPEILSDQAMLGEKSIIKNEIEGSGPIDEQAGEAFLHLGNIYYQQQKFSEAIKYLIKAKSYIEQLPKEEGIKEKMKLADACLKTDLYSDAQYLCDEILEKFPENADAWAFKGKAIFESSQEINNHVVEELIQTYKKSLSIDAHNVWALIYLAELHCRTGNLVQAEKLIQQALKDHPEHDYAQYVFGNILFEKKETDKSIDAFQEAIRQNPFFSLPRAKLGMVYYYLGNYKAAQEQYETVLEINPADYNTHFNLGVLFQQVGQLKEAAAQFIETIQLYPQHHKAYYELGTIYQGNNQFNEAIEAYQKSLAVKSDQVQILLALGTVYLMKNLIDEAKNYFVKVLELEPDNKIALQQIELIQSRKSTRIF